MEKTYTLRDFCKRRRITREWLVGECGSLEVDADKSRLPEDELVVGGDLMIKCKDKCSLPPVIRVGGDLTLIGHGITELPQCVEVQRTLELRNTNVRFFHEGCKANELKVVNSLIERLPENLTLAGGATFENCPLLTLPDGLNVRSLYIKRCHLTSLPQRLTVHRVLEIKDSPINEIPADSQIGSLYANYTRIKTLPDNWGVKLDLLLEGAALRRLPKRLHVGGLLDISKTDIREIPADCVVRSLFATESCLERLPDNWTVDHYLNLRGCRKLERLPNHLTCNGSLIICETKIKEIPDDCLVGSLDAAKSDLEKLPDNWSVNGNVSLSVCKRFKTLPKNLHVGETLDISRTTVTEIPDDCQFGGLNATSSELVRLSSSLHVRKYLCIENCPLKSLPANLFVGVSLFANDSGLEALPEGLVVGDDLSLKNTKVSEVPADLVVGKALYLNNCRIDSIPKEVIAGTIHCDQSVVNKAYSFNLDRLDVHPNGQFVGYQNRVYRLVDRTEDFLTCSEIGSGDSLFFVSDEHGHVGASYFLPLAKALLMYAQRKLNDFD